MEEKLARYYELKQEQKQIEEELEILRGEILEHYMTPTIAEVGAYKLIIKSQERREYDDRLLYNALPDGSMWKLLSKVDPTKLSGLIKLNILSEESLEGTYRIKEVPYIQVQKR